MKKIGIILLFCLILTSCKQAIELVPLAEVGPVLEVHQEDLRTVETQDYFERVDLFSAALTTKLCVNTEDNTCISPLSIFMAFSLATMAAEGTSQETILSFLGVETEKIASKTSLLYSVVNRSKDNLVVKLSNSLWLDQSVQYSSEVMKELAYNQYCYAYMVDFYNQNKEANQAIRNNIREQTNGFIDQDFNLSRETIMAIINTLYFKDCWIYGDTLKKEKKEFREVDGTLTKKDFLYGKYVAGIAGEEEQYRHFYTTTNHGYSLCFVVPKEGYSLTNVWTKENIYHVMNNTYEIPQNTYTRCIFPVFSASYNEEIIKKLDLPSISFNRLLDDDNILKNVQHVTKFEVDEQEIEGAAVTILDVAPTSPGPDEIEEVYLDFIVDQAFGYILMDANGIPLFTGTIYSC